MPEKLGISPDSLSLDDNRRKAPSILQLPCFGDCWMLAGLAPFLFPIEFQTQSIKKLMNPKNDNCLITVFAQDALNTGRGNIVRVFWRMGRDGVCKGAYDILIPPAYVLDAAILGELAALRHLLGVRRISGENRNGTGLHLVVSRGAIKKLAEKKSSKAYLAEFSHFLTTRYFDAQIIVEKDKGWLPADPGQVKTVEINLDGINPIEFIETPLLGKVTISSHALTEYAAVAGTADASQSWRSISRRLKGRLSKVEISVSLASVHRRKYPNKSSETWKHPDDTMHFVFSREKPDLLVIVTVYQVDPQEGLPKYPGAM